MTRRTAVSEANRIVDVITRLINKNIQSMAHVETTWGEVAAVDTGANTVDVYLQGSATASLDFRIRGGGMPAVATIVKVAIDKGTGDRWVVEPIFAVASTTGTPTSLSHVDLTNVTSDQHHARDHSVTGTTHTTAETDTTKRLAPNGSGGVAWAAAGSAGHTIKEAGTPLTTRTGLNFGAGFDLADDSPNDETDVAIDLLELTDFTDHSARHENGGADELEVLSLGTSETDTAKRLGPNGTGGVSWAAGISNNVALNFVLDGAGVVVPTGSRGYVEIPFACTITAARLAADQTGSIVVDVKKATYAGLFTTTSIAASAKPTLSSARKFQDTTLTGWTTSISAGDWLEFVVDSATTVQRVTLSLTLLRS